MKKIILLIFISIIFTSSIYALEDIKINLIKDRLLNEGIIFDTQRYENSIDWKYDLENKIDLEVKKISSDAIVHLTKYTYNNCDVIIKYLNEDKVYNIISVKNIPIKLYGIVFKDDNIISKVGDEFEIIPNYYDSEFNNIDYKMDLDYYDEESKSNINIINNKIKVMGSGLFSIKVTINNKNDTLIYKINVYANLQEYINKRMDKLSLFNLDVGKYGMNYDEAIYHNLLNSKSYSRRLSNTICSNDICNIDFKINYRDLEYNIKKESLKTKKVGIILNTDNKDIVIDKGNEYKIDYSLFSERVDWYSTDESIAIINSDGVIKGISEGACLVIGITNDKKNIVLVVKVKGNESKTKKYLDNILNELVGSNKTIVIPFVSDSSDIVFKKHLYDYLYKEILNISNDQKIKLIYKYEDDLKDYSKLRNIKIGLNYLYDLHYTENNSTYYYDGSYCSPDSFQCFTDTIDVRLIFENDKSDFDKKILARARDLLKKIVNKKEHSTYLNTILKKYGESDFNNIITQNVYYEDVDNDKDFEITFYPIEYNDAASIGQISISKNGIMYITSDDLIVVNNVFKVVRESILSEEQIIDYIEKEVKRIINNKDNKISVSKYNENIYEININDNIIKTYIEYVDLKVNSNPIVSIYKGNNNSLLLKFEKIMYANSYDIYRSISKNKNYKKIATVNKNEYVDTGLTYGKTYYYKVIAKNDISKSNYSNIVSMKVTPNNVEITKSTVGTNSINIEWNKEDVSGYEVFRSIDKRKWIKIKTISNNILKYDDNRLKSNKTYYYKIRTYKKNNGKKVYSIFSKVLAIKTSPSYPKIIISDGKKMLTIKIISVKGASYYELYRSVDQKDNFVKIKELRDNLIYEDKQLEIGKTYYYKAKACNSEKSCSNFSKVISKKVLK